MGYAVKKRTPIAARRRIFARPRSRIRLTSSSRFTSTSLKGRGLRSFDKDVAFHGRSTGARSYGAVPQHCVAALRNCRPYPAFQGAGMSIPHRLYASGGEACSDPAELCVALLDGSPPLRLAQALIPGPETVEPGRDRLAVRVRRRGL